MDITVYQSGNGNTILVYTEQDYDSMDAEYQSSRDGFKQNLIQMISDLGFTVQEENLLIDSSQLTRSLSASMTLVNFAQKKDSTTWQVNCTLVKNIYPLWVQSDRSFTFYVSASAPRPELPFPEAFKIILPSNVVEIQFSSNDYMLTYQKASGAAVTINFATDPSNTGSITFDGSNYGDGATASKSTGTYVISAHPASGYTFSRWEPSGLIFPENLNSDTTDCIINGVGTIKMIQTSSTSPQTPAACIIATATYGSDMAPEVSYMRHVRDQMIGSNLIGEMLVNGWNNFYYYWSPPIAHLISSNNMLQKISQVLIIPLYIIIHMTAFTYTNTACLGASAASIAAFLFASISSILIYILMPIYTVQLFSKKITKKARAL
ncbi:CFI-box-CTERM domain-containing protein [[Eubacterium] cellulosolvens]